MHRLAVLSSAPPSGSGFLEIHFAALREYGYIKGRNLEVLLLYGDGKKEGLPALANDIVRWKPDIIVSFTTPEIRAAQRATDTIPIVMVLARDVVKEGIVTSLARPGGNVTGLTQDVGTATSEKQFDFLKEAFPQLSRIAVLWDTRSGCPASCKTNIEKGGARIGAQLMWFDFQDDLEPVVAAAVRQGAQVLITGGGPRTFHRRKDIVDLAAKYRLVDMHPYGAFVDAGGLMSYSTHWPSLFIRAAYYVDRILRGTKPSDLPVEQPTKFEFAINIKAAKARGVAIPQSLLLQADRVIE
jgi:putative ABC transport system substrate-binding protein